MNKYSHTPKLIAAAGALALAVSAIAQPTEEDGLTEELLFKAMPELNSPPVATKSSNAVMKCYVDTPAFDVPTVGNCFSVGWAVTTSAVFSIDNAPSSYTVLWSDSSCSSSSLYCVVPIRQYQSKTISATVLDHSDNTFSQTQATAHYEGFF